MVAGLPGRGHGWGSPGRPSWSQQATKRSAGWAPASPNWIWRSTKPRTSSLTRWRPPTSTSTSRSTSACRTRRRPWSRPAGFYSVTCADVTFRKERRAVVLRLPVSKTRTHVCICSPVNAPGCPAETHPSLMFTRLQKCACSQGRSRCAFSTLSCVWSWTCAFDNSSCRRSSCSGMKGPQPFARSVLWPRRPRSSCRSSRSSRWVAGARPCQHPPAHHPGHRALGSAAIMRYVQNSVFVPEQAAFTVQAAWFFPAISSSASGSSAQGSGSLNSAEVWSIVRRVVSEVWQHQAAFVHNPRSKFAHRPSPSEHSLASEHWLSACGRWKYGRSNCLRHPVLPGFQKCAKCFSEDPAAAPAPQGEEEQSSSSSSSS